MSLTLLGAAAAALLSGAGGFAGGVALGRHRLGRREAVVVQKQLSELRQDLRQCSEIATDAFALSKDLDLRFVEMTARQEEFIGEVTEWLESQREEASALVQRLQETQAFIVTSVQEAQTRREVFSQPPVAVPPVAMPSVGGPPVAGPPVAMPSVGGPPVAGPAPAGEMARLQGMGDVAALIRQQRELQAEFARRQKEGAKGPIAPGWTL